MKQGINLNKIALEEHFSIEALLPTEDQVAFFDPQVLAQIEPLLPELAEQRLSNMDKAGIEIAVLSQTAPGIQGVASKSAVLNGTAGGQARG